MDDAENTPIEAAWERIENWLTDNAPFTLVTLNEGATERDIWAAQSALGFPLPADIAESWRIHNGQAEGMLIAEAQLLPLGQMMPVPQNRAWLPLTANDAGPVAFLEPAAPAQRADGGRVVARTAESDAPVVLATSFTAWLQAFVNDLEAERYVWSNDTDGLMRRETLKALENE